jgi:molybdopterin converting factor subunit 1
VTIRLLYFASFREAAGRDEEARAVPEGTTVGALWKELCGEVPLFARFPSMPAAAVNREYVSAAQALGENDEVAFLPPVAGG